MVTARNRAPAIPRCVQTPFELDDAQSSGVHLCSFQLPWAIAEARVATTVSPQRSLGTGAGVVTSDVCCVVSTNFELESFTFLEVPKHVFLKSHDSALRVWNAATVPAHGEAY